MDGDKKLIGIRMARSEDEMDRQRARTVKDLRFTEVLSLVRDTSWHGNAGEPTACSYAYTVASSTAPKSRIAGSSALCCRDIVWAMEGSVCLSVSGRWVGQSWSGRPYLPRHLAQLGGDVEHVCRGPGQGVSPS